MKRMLRTIAIMLSVVFAAAMFPTLPVAAVDWQGGYFEYLMNSVPVNSRGFFLADCSYDGIPELFYETADSGKASYLRMAYLSGGHVKTAAKKVYLGKDLESFTVFLSQWKSGGYVWNVNSIARPSGREDRRVSIELKASGGTLSSVEMFRIEQQSKARKYFVKGKAKNTSDYNSAWVKYFDRIGSMTEVTVASAGKATLTTVYPSHQATYLAMIKREFPVASIALSKSALTLKIGKTYTLKATVRPAYTLDKTTTWTTSDASVATVGGGVVRAMKPGKAVITATASSGKYGTCTVTVPRPAATKVTISGGASVAVGGSLQLKATVLPSSASQSVKWSSSNRSLATVSDTGLVKGLRTGSVTITAITNDSAKKKARYKLRIVAPTPTPTPTPKPTPTPASVQWDNNWSRERKLEELRKLMPDGYYWNAGVTVGPSTPVANLKSTVTAKSANIYNTWQGSYSARQGGHGFARVLGWFLTGVEIDDARWIAQTYDSVQPGDYVRYSRDGVIIAAIVVSKSGDTLQLVECNNGHPNYYSTGNDSIINWQAMRTRSFLESCTWVNYWGYHAGPNPTPTPTPAPTPTSTPTPDTITATYYSQVGDKGGRHPTFAYSDTFFASPSTVISKDLIKASVTMAGVVSGDFEGTKRNYIIKALTDMKFPITNSYWESYPEPTEKNPNTIGYSMARKQIKVNGTTYNLYIILVCGTRGAEWFSNFDPGEGGATSTLKLHQGFVIPASSMYNEIKPILSKTDAKTNKIWIMGHSRGAAVANIIAGWLSKSESYASLSNVYCYTSACPSVSNQVDTSLRNIYNLNNPGDLIPYLPLQMWGFNRNGMTITLPESNAGTMKASFKKVTGVDYAGFTYRPDAEFALEKWVPTYASYYANASIDPLVKFSPKDVFYNISGALQGGIGAIGYVAKLASQFLDCSNDGRLTLDYFLWEAKFTDAVPHGHCQETYIAWVNTL